jgi:hypothetical protein
MTASDAPPFCFVVAANSVETPAILEAVARAGANPIVMEDLAPRRGLLVEILRDAMSSVDVVVGVLSASVANDSTIFVLGMAAALGKPTIVVTSQEMAIPDWPGTTMTVREVGPRYDALRFALKQVLHGLSEGIVLPTRLPAEFPPSTLNPIGEFSHRLLRGLDEAGERPTETELVGILAQALEAGGASPVVEGGPDARFDLGVWDAELEALVGNPLVIEVKTELRDADSTVRALAQVERYLVATGGRWALLVYGSGNDAMVRDVAWTRPVLTSSLRELLAALSDASFSQYVSRLRAERVHTSPAQ